MTEAEWRTTDSVWSMVQSLSGRRTRMGFGRGRFQVFAWSCVFRVQLYLGGAVQAVLDRLERPAGGDQSVWGVWHREQDGLREALRVRAAHTASQADLRASSQLWTREWAMDAVFSAAYSKSYTAALSAPRHAARAVGLVDRLATYPPGSPVTHEELGLDYFPESSAERVVQAGLVRCVFGNPFRPVAFDPAWRTEAAVSLVRGMDETRDFSAMPVLADALEDAGCADAEVLAHCRGPGPHARGCHALDRVLGRW